MKLPEFTADISLYRSGNRYQNFGAFYGGQSSTQSVVPALTNEGQAKCEACKFECAKSYTICLGSATAGYGIAAAGCLALGFPPAIAICEGVAAGVYAAASVTCLATSYVCLGLCSFPGQACCPVFCELGRCCSEGETCMADRCCPKDHAVCGGTCCAKGETCCGDSCCPAHYFCRDGFCSEFPADSLWPDDWKPVKPSRPGLNYCRIGWEPCGGTCCAPGLECCSVGGGRVACMTNCLR